jgi:hypothetical protein
MITPAWTYQILNSSSKDQHLKTTLIQRGNSTPNNFFSYENPTLRLKTIKYPSNWERKQQNKNTIIFLSPLENQSDPFRENLLINTFPSTGVQLDQQVSIDINRLRQNFTNLQVIDSSANDSVAHNTAYRTIYTYNKDRLDFKVLQLWTMVGDRTYTIKYTAEAAKYSQYLPTIQKTIRSLEIQGIKASQMANIGQLDQLGFSTGAQPYYISINQVILQMR